MNLPIELIREILKYELTEVAQARTSMADFKSIFSNLPIASVVENHQLNTLITYEKTHLENLIENTENTENTYKNMFTNLQNSCASIKDKRAPLIFSRAVHAAECGFKFGFINTRGKLGLF